MQQTKYIKIISGGEIKFLMRLLLKPVKLSVHGMGKKKMVSGVLRPPYNGKLFIHLLGHCCQKTVAQVFERQTVSLYYKFLKPIC